MKNTGTWFLIIAFAAVNAGCTKDNESPGVTLTGSSQGLTISLINSTGKYSDDNVFFSVMGWDKDKQYCWVDSTGALHRISKADNFPDTTTRYTYSLKNVKSIKISQLENARIRISVGKKYKLICNDNNTFAYDIDVNNPTNPNLHIICDKIEFGYISQQLYPNTTACDFIGIPMKITTVAGSQQYSSGWAKTRKEIFKHFESSAPQAFQILLQGNYRINNPTKLLAFDQHYFDAYIDSVWNKYKTDSLTLTGLVPVSWKATGKVVGNVFTFKGKEGYPGEIVTIEKPTSNNVFGCDGKLASSGSVLRQKILAEFGAALNRSTLLTHTTLVCDTGAFYKHPTTNWFSKVLHDCATDHKCYGFPFDDVCDQSSLINGQGVTEFKIELLPFE